MPSAALERSAMTYSEAINVFIQMQIDTPFKEPTPKGVTVNRRTSIEEPVFSFTWRDREEYIAGRLFMTRGNHPAIWWWNYNSSCYRRIDDICAWLEKHPKLDFQPTSWSMDAGPWEITNWLKAHRCPI